MIFFISCSNLKENKVVLCLISIILFGKMLKLQENGVFFTKVTILKEKFASLLIIKILQILC